jgi:hypothetical protein
MMRFKEYVRTRYESDRQNKSIKEYVSNRRVKTADNLDYLTGAHTQSTPKNGGFHA